MAVERALIFCVEFRGAEVGTNSDARPFADAYIPVRPPVSGDLALKVGRTGRGIDELKDDLGIGFKSFLRVCRYRQAHDQ